jgi:hypothetical protein
VGTGTDHAPAKEHDPEKWAPVFGTDHAPAKEHDPEKACPGFDREWAPVVGKDRAAENVGDALIQPKAIMR